MPVKTALIVGASGLVGGHCLHELLNSLNYSQVTSLGRRKLDITHQKLKQEIIDFDDMGLYADLFKADDAFCCLGTTIAKAGSQENFRAVDHDYVVNTAKQALTNGASKFLVVSSIGANPDSSIFYTKVKGQVEEDLKKLHFPELHIFRPASLSGNRKEFRLGEKVGLTVLNTLSFVLIGGLKKYKPINAATVAKAMARIASTTNPGIHIYESDQIAKTGKH